ncbi:hypothetical protein ACFQ36_02530 [Arthrobacter sp. GCM10027362]|uniref:hypothetical protein n=1 Tax=Arthrobacter sp. GCM10027362 TaxID=3273379 RepID=UPI00362A49D4
MPQEFADVPDGTGSTVPINAKGAIDGAKTLSEAAGFLETRAAWLRSLEARGYQLTRPIQEDRGSAELVDPEV